MENYNSMNNLPPLVKCVCTFMCVLNGEHSVRAYCIHSYFMVLSVYGHSCIVLRCTGHRGAQHNLKKQGACIMRVVNLNVS